MRAMRGAQREHSGVPRIAPSRDHESVRDKEQVAREAIERTADNHVKPTTAHLIVSYLPCVRESHAPGS